MSEQLFAKGNGKTMDISIDVDVHCTDGGFGKTTCVIINPTTRDITHVVVKSKVIPHPEYLVPVELVARATPAAVELTCSRADVETFDKFLEHEFLHTDGPLGHYPADLNALEPYVQPLDGQFVELVHERIPNGLAAIHRGAKIVAIDGQVGQVDEFMVEPQNGHVTHLLLQHGHFWGKKDVVIPASAIDEIRDGTIRLNVNKEDIEAMPAIPHQRKAALKLTNGQLAPAEQGGPTPTILVLMDGSPAAKVGATMAIQLAQGQSLAIRGLYVVDEALVLDPYSDYSHELTHTGVPQSRAELVGWFKQQGDYALRWLEDRCQDANVPVETELLFGGVPDIILRQKDQVVLLALGRQGRAQAGTPAALGHNFRAIAHHSHIPLLVGGRDPRRIQNILLVHELNKPSQLALSWTERLQESLPAALTVLTSFENGNGPATLQGQMNRSGIHSYHLIFGEELSAGRIADTAAAAHADLIVMGGYRHNALLTKFVGSTLEQVLEQTALPVLLA